MNKELHRLLELSGVVTKSGIVNHLYENYHDSSYKEVKGFDGPFKMKNGRVVHYNVSESKYYDARTASYLNEQEVAELYKTDNKFTEGVVLNASRNGEKISLRLEGMMEMRPMVTTLRNNGYDDFEATDDNGEEIDVDNFAGGEEEVEDKPASEQLQDIISKAQELTDVVDSENGMDSTWKEKLTVVDDYLSGLLSDVQGDDVQGDDDQEFGDDSEEVSSPDMDEPQMESKKKVNERKLSKSEKEKLDRLKKKHEDGEMHKSMIDQYGKEKGDEVFYGKLTKMAKEGQEEIDEKAEVESGMSKSDFIEYFKSNILPSIAKRFEKNGTPDKPARREAWNDAIDGLIKDGKISKIAGDWTIPRELETKKLKESYNYKVINELDSFDDEKAKDTSKVFSKGDKVEYKGKEKFVVVPDGPGQMVGIADKPDGKPDMVKASEVSSVLQDKKDLKENKFSKGDKVEYKGKEKFVVDPNWATGGKWSEKEKRFDKTGVAIADSPDVDVYNLQDMKKHNFDVIKEPSKIKSLNESKSFSKGDKVEYNGEEKFVVDDDMKNGKVGIADRKDVDFYKPQDLHNANYQAVNASNLRSLNEDSNAVDATLWNKEAMPHNAIDDAQQKAERTGQADRETKIKTPKEVIKAIDNRIKELENSIDTYDEKGYDEKSMKVNTIESLQQIKENLQRGTYEGFMQAQIFFGTLMSPIWDLIPSQVVNYLAKGPSDE